MRLLVTGAAGFIGSTYVRLIGEQHDVVVLDKLTYAGRRENLPEEVELVVGGIEDPAVVREAMDGCDAVVNFAAESHVDRSIDDQDAFARTHVIGTGVLLDAARELGVGRYLQVSTDEVYGSIESGSFTETSPLDPSSPYSATKAAGDLLVAAHFHTYGIEASICRGSNNYGPRQYPEKLIPLTVLNALHGDSLPVYGDGRQVRNWLYVEDFCRGIHTVLTKGRPGEAYNVGGPDECENIEVVKRVIELTGADESLNAVAASTSKFDLSVALAEQRTATGEPAGINGVLEYASDLFERGTVETLGQRLMRLLSAAVADASRPLGSLAILDAAERGTILEGFNATGRGGRWPAVRHSAGAVCRAGARTPDAVAVVFEDRELSYARARRPRQPPGASSARPRASGPRPWWGSASSARPRW